MSERANIDLTNQFLIAMPAMADPNFAGAVIYVCEHTAKGRWAWSSTGPPT